MVFRPQPQQLRPHQRPALQIERLACLLGGKPLRFPLALLVRTEVHNRHGQLQFAGHHLYRGAVLPGESRAQNFVPPHNLIKTALQRFSIQLSLNSQRPRDEVRGAARLQLLQKPQPLLRERGWKHVLRGLRIWSGTICRRIHVHLCRIWRQRSGEGAIKIFSIIPTTPRCRENFAQNPRPSC